MRTPEQCCYGSPRVPLLPPAGLSEAACLNTAFWELFRSAMGDQGKAAAEQGVRLGKPFTAVVEGTRSVC